VACVRERGSVCQVVKESLTVCQGVSVNVINVCKY